MKKIKMLFLLIVPLLFVGCMDKRICWISQTKPVTEQERKAVADEEAKILASVLGTRALSLNGHDQEYYKLVSAAHDSAIESCCVPRLFEYEIPAGFLMDYGCGHYTGNWKPYLQNTN